MIAGLLDRKQVLYIRIVNMSICWCLAEVRLGRYSLSFMALLVYFQFKSNLYHLIVDTVSEEARDRIYNSSYEFVDCVKQLLEATKVLTYS